MREDTPRPEIDSAKLRVGGEIVGAAFTIGTMLIFLIGIPALWYIFPAAIVLGCMVALVLHFLRRDRPGAPWLLAMTENQADLPRQPERQEHPPRSLKVLPVPIATPI